MCAVRDDSTTVYGTLFSVKDRNSEKLIDHENVEDNEVSPRKNVPLAYDKTLSKVRPWRDLEEEGDA